MSPVVRSSSDFLSAYYTLVFKIIILQSTYYYPIYQMKYNEVRRTQPIICRARQTQVYLCSFLSLSPTEHRTINKPAHILLERIWESALQYWHSSKRRRGNTFTVIVLFFFFQVSNWFICFSS